jgi:hypothetical protein
MDLYEKLDADLRAGTDEGDETPSEETATASSDDSNKCPF